MPKYLDGVQQTEDIIHEFNTIGSGTITVGTNQYPPTTLILRPTKLYKNYILVVHNKSGQTINTVVAIGNQLVNNTPTPNTGTGNSIILKSLSPVSPLTNTVITVFDLTSEEPNPFAVGNVKFQFSLATAPTSGTIDWALIGY